LVNDDLSVDNSSTVPAKKGMGRRLATTMVTRRQKGSKIHATVVTPIPLPIAIDLGPGNEHESRRWLITLLKDIRIIGTEDPGIDQSGFMLTTSTILLW
jgi:hypothetical protein